MSKKASKKLIIICICILALAIVLAVSGYLLYKFLNSPTFQPVDYLSETWQTPTTPFDINKAVLEGEAYILPYNSDGTFTMMHVTDVHLRRGPLNGNAKNYRLLSEAFAYRKPDLVVVTGDLVFSWNGEKMLRQFAQFMEDEDMYWAYAFGNHDGQYSSNLKDLGFILEEYPHALFAFGPEWARGESNYVIGIADAAGIVRQAAIMLDSHDSRYYEVNGKKELGYDYIYPSQIAWFEWVSQGLDVESPVPMLVFQHIPLPEYHVAWDTGYSSGVKNEESCSPLINTGLFDAMVEDGDTLAVFAGHDHTNDFIATLDDIMLVYGKSSSWGSYGHKDVAKGVRYITLFANDPWAITFDSLTTKDLNW